MDEFQYIILKENLRNTASVVPTEVFEKLLPTLKEADYEELFEILSSPDIKPLEDGRAVATFLHLLWHYR